MKQGCHITGNRTRVLAHQRPTKSALITIVIIIFIIIIFVSFGFTIIIIIIIIIITSENLVLHTSSRQQSNIRQDPWQDSLIKCHANVPKFSLWWSNLFNLINLPEVSQVFPDAEFLKSATFLQTWFHQNLCTSSWIQTMYGYLIFLTQSFWKAVLLAYHTLHLLQKRSFLRNCIKCCPVTQLHIPTERRYSPKNTTPNGIVILGLLF